MSKKEREFHAVLSIFEDLLCDETFMAKHDGFIEEACDLFQEDMEEHTLEQYDFFRNYVEVMNAVVMEFMKKRSPKFNLDEFAAGCAEFMSPVKQDDEVQLGDGEDVLDVLATMADYSKFRDDVLSVKAGKRAEAAFMVGAEGHDGDAGEGGTHEGGDCSSAMFGLGICVTTVRKEDDDNAAPSQ